MLQPTAGLFVITGTVGSILAGFSIRDIWQSFRCVSCNSDSVDPIMAKIAEQVFIAVGRAAILSGIIGFLAYLSLDLFHLGMMIDLAKNGEDLSYPIIPLVYGFMIKLLIADPLKNAASTRIARRPVL
jgi:hypothetical protein